MNELTKIKDRILARIENYIADIELAEEQGLTEDEKTILASVKEIINEEFEGTVPLPRFIIHKDGRMEQIKTSDEEQKFYENTIHFADAIIRLSQTCGISHSEAKDVIEESMEMLKKIQTDTAKWVIAGVGIDCTGYRFKEYKCSNCGNIDLSHKKNKFCPECGRRMVE